MKLAKLITVGLASLALSFAGCATTGSTETTAPDTMPVDSTMVPADTNTVETDMTAPGNTTVDTATTDAPAASNTATDTAMTAAPVTPAP